MPTIKNPMLHKSGRPRLGPLNVEQLKDLISKTSSPKQRSKIQRELDRRNDNQ
jgi:hypothetical protein